MKNTNISIDALKAICKDPWASVLKTLWKLCLKIEEEKASERIICPPVKFVRDFISNIPI